jgi:hypothetical protein
MNRRMITTTGAAAGMVALTATAALASWGATAAGSATAQSTAMPAGSQPTKPVATASTSVGTIVVQWPVANYPTVTPTTPVPGYVVKRYKGGVLDGTGPAGNCTGTVAALTCSDAVTVTGAYTYTVTPVSGASSQWKGAESPASAAYNYTSVSAPVVPTSVSITNLQGKASNFVNSSTVAGVTVRTVLPAGAQVGDQVVLTATDTGSAHTVTGTSAALTSAGAQNVDQTLDLTTLNQGSLTITSKVTNAAGTSSTVSTTASKDTVAPTVTTLSLGGNSGAIGSGDTVSVTYSTDLDASSICSAWNNTGAQSQAGNSDITVTLNQVASSDTITLAAVASACSTFRFGTVDTKANYVNTASLTFGGSGSNKSTLSYVPSSGVFTVTLGSAGGSGSATTGNAASTPSYTPLSGIVDLAGNPLATTAVNGTSSRF